MVLGTPDNSPAEFLQFSSQPRCRMVEWKKATCLSSGSLHPVAELHLTDLEKQITDIYSGIRALAHKLISISLEKRNLLTGG